MATIKSRVPKNIPSKVAQGRFDKDVLGLIKNIATKGAVNYASPTQNPARGRY